MVSVLKDMNLCALHHHWQTITYLDLVLVDRLCRLDLYVFLIFFNKLLMGVFRSGRTKEQVISMNWVGYTEPRVVLSPLLSLFLFAILLLILSQPQPKTPEEESSGGPTTRSHSQPVCDQFELINLMVTFQTGRHERRGGGIIKQATKEKI